MKPNFLNIEKGSGKIIAEALDKIFLIIVGNNSLYSGCERVIIDKKDLDLAENYLRLIDQEIQEGSEWITD